MLRACVESWEGFTEDAHTGGRTHETAYSSGAAVVVVVLVRTGVLPCFAIFEDDNPKS